MTKEPRENGDDLSPGPESLRFDFVAFPAMHGSRSAVRPVVRVGLQELPEAPLVCLLDTGSIRNIFGVSIANELGISLAGEPEKIAVGGSERDAWIERLDFSIGRWSFETPVAFVDPWDDEFQILGTDGMRSFIVTVAADAGWTEIAAAYPA